MRSPRRESAPPPSSRRGAPAPGDERGAEPGDWTLQEQGFADMKRSLARMFWRATHRPAWVLGIALAVTALLVARRASAPLRYTASVTLRVTESSFQQERQSVPRNLREHLLASALASPRLARIIEEHGLYAKLAALDMPSAVASMREDTSVEIFSNFLSAERLPGDPPRAARIKLSYRSARAAVAMDVAHALADAVVEAENAKRAGDAAVAEDAVSGGQDALRERYYRLSEARKASEREDETAGLAKPSARTIGWRHEEGRLKDWLEQSERQRTNLELITRAETLGLGTRIDRVYEELTTQGGDSPLALGVLALLVFTVTAAGAAMAIGAFDTRIRDGRDVADAGSRVLAEVPRERRRRARRAEA